MTRPLPTGKQSVNLAAPAPRVSRIRRDPPPVVKQKLVLNPKEQERRDVVIGILAFALAMFVIILAFASYSGWTPAQYTVHVDLS